MPEFNRDLHYVLPMEGFQNVHQVERVHSYPATCITELLRWHTVIRDEGICLVYLLRGVVFLTRQPE